MELLEQSLIDNIDLTAWKRDPDSYEEGTSLNFHLAEATKVQFILHYREKTLDSDSQYSFAKILAKEAHELDLQEREEIEMVLRNASEKEYFGFSNIRTELLNGRMVLIIEGIWKHTAMNTYGVFISKDSPPGFVEEIHYLAPQASYSMHIGKALDALNSIRWKEPK